MKIIQDIKRYRIGFVIGLVYGLLAIAATIYLGNFGQLTIQNSTCFVPVKEAEEIRDTYAPLGSPEAISSRLMGCTPNPLPQILGTVFYTAQLTLYFFYLTMTFVLIPLGGIPAIIYFFYIVVLLINALFWGIIGLLLEAIIRVLSTKLKATK
jgi:hypothetical protein